MIVSSATSYPRTYPGHYGPAQAPVAGIARPGADQPPAGPDTDGLNKPPFSTSPYPDETPQKPPDPSGQSDGSQPDEKQESLPNTAPDHKAQLTPEELQLVEKLENIDKEVRQHEMAHLAAGGSYITSAASFSYKTGPDGKRYAVGGEVGIDVAPVPGDPEATIRKMRQVKNAALAPARPSAQDLKVASNAASESAKALADLTLLKAKEQAEQREAQAFGTTRQKAAQTYTRVNSLPEEDTGSFRLAV